MDINGKSKIEESDLSRSQMIFMELQNQCALCGSDLEISVTTFLEDFALKETATCPKCQITTRIKDHKMH